VWSDSERAELEAWLNESTLHRVAFLRLDAVWKQAERLRALGASARPGIIAVHGPQRDIAWYRWLGIAAGFAVAALAGTYLYLTHFHGITRYSTAVGGLETIALADGSRVTLNTGTVIRVAFDRAQRRIELDTGEAYFVVAHDPSRPFTVLVANKRVAALGTEFSVRRTDDDVQVIVADGRVQLSSTGPDTAGPGRPGQPQASASLAQGAMARTRHSLVEVDQVSDGELGELLSWREGFVVFKDSSLAEAVAELNRYHLRKIVIDDPSIDNIRISGKFRAGNTEAFLWLLQQGFPVTVEQQKGQIILRRRA
jgi:transmembrane sensor